MMEQENETRQVREGRVLRLRLGINPNSSGHGILIGALFFLPPAIVSTLVTTVAQVWLDKALRDYGRDRAARRWWDLIVPLLWGLAWAGFFGMWLMLIMEDLSESYWLAGLSALVTVALTYLAWRQRSRPALAKATIYAAGLAVVPSFAVGVILALAEIVFIEPPWLFAIGYAYLMPLAMVYAALAAKLGLGLPRLATAIGYAVLGMALVLAFAPVVTILLQGSRDTNPVGLFFFLWGWGVPPALAI